MQVTTRTPDRSKSLGHFVANVSADHILARGEKHLGCPSQVAGPLPEGFGHS